MAASTVAYQCQLIQWRQWRGSGGLKLQCIRNCHVC